MIPIRTTPTLLAATIGLLLACAGAGAQTSKSDADKARELENARTELNRAAQRYAELSRENIKFDRVQFEREFEKRFARQPVLGVVLSPEPKAGVRIAAVTPDSAAAKAGLRSGDVLTAINGKNLDQKDADARLEQARAQLRTLDVKSPIALAYTRDGRAATARATPQIGDRLLVTRDADGNPLARPMAIVAPQVRNELIRLDCDPGDDDCRLPALTEAFRWNGLNLATVDAQLGRYFGTDRGVLVLSTGPELAGLQAGDVIQRIDNKPVNSPREAMAALRGKPADSRVGVTYLRDRKSATTQITVPKTAMLRIPRPPVPPLPPAAPKPPAVPAVPALPAPPTAPKPPQAMTPPSPPAAPRAPEPPEPSVVVVRSF
ncbi:MULTISPECIES: PDZ domain-containing protein [unclassified Lysobacter]|uniref:PDZ domain-containing protein n=1 Tax=unclassified Lysobacter TaxID=2635362 RepID=UPI001C2291D6|nr:PDZ domain-containing protein [Lysobacter sp. MMG2]MBU8976670.1 PDZ domain-containing protein [Lysobacter sp. MMG2]